VIHDPYPVFRPLPASLTDPLPYPPGLPARFTTVDALDMIFYLYDTVDLANADRECAKRIVEGGSCDGITDSPE